MAQDDGDGIAWGGGGVSFLSTAVEGVLEDGRFCAVATTTARGPHLTPLVFVASGGRVWLTTSRGSVKARAWKEDPSVAGLVRAGELAVAFTGTVKTYDALDRHTWAAAATGATQIARAGARFSRKNARFFAGYAIDARQVPLAWTPPGRVFVGIDLERIALVDDDGVGEGKGRWGGEVRSHGAFRRTTKAADPLAGLPEDVIEPLGRSGDGSLAVEGSRGTVVLPVTWLADDHALYAVMPTETLALADAPADAPMALTVDRASQWRAKDMVGAMVQGEGAVFELGQLGSGAKAARILAATISPAVEAPGGGTLIRLSPRRLVWWKGWSGGSASVP